MTTASEFKDIGNKHLRAEEFDEAISAYSKAIELDPNDHVFYSNRSAAYLSKGMALEALSDGEKCIELKADWPKGYTRKGAALHSLKRYDEAISAYNDGLAIAPEDAGLKSGLSEVKKAQSSSSAPSRTLFSPAAMAKLATHPVYGPKLADPLFQMKIQMANQNPQYLTQDPEMLGVLSAILGLKGDGLDDEDSPLPPFRSSPSSANAPTKEDMDVVKEPEIEVSEEEKEQNARKLRANEAKEKGNNFYKAKSFQEALGAYDEAIELDPSNMMFINNKAAVYIEMGDQDRAISLCEEALEVGRQNRASYTDKSKVYQRMATAYQKKDDFPNAIAAYGKAQMENFDKAVERKVKTLELEFKKKQIEAYIDPEKGLEAKERGNNAFRDGNFSLAIEEYEEAVKRDPTNASYRNNFAATLVKVGDLIGAKNQVEKALELDKKYVKAWAKKGDIEFFMKEYHKAMDSYKAGLEIEPDNSLCKQGLQKTVAKVNASNYGGEVDAERQAHAMADPEIQNILRDPSVNQVLRDFQENPKHAQLALNDPDIRAKIEKLVAAGILQLK